MSGVYADCKKIIWSPKITLCNQRPDDEAFCTEKVRFYSVNKGK